MSIEFTPSRFDGQKFVYLGFIVGPLYAVASPDLSAVQVRVDVGGLRALHTVTLATSEDFIRSLPSGDASIVWQAVKMLRKRLYTLAQQRKDRA